MLLENGSSIYYKLIVTENDWTANFRKYLTGCQACKEYERNLKNAFIRTRLQDFLSLEANKQTQDELFNYLNIEILPAEEDEKIQLYPENNSNIIYYAVIESCNLPFPCCFEGDETADEESSAPLEDIVALPWDNINFDFLTSNLTSTEKQTVLKNLNRELNEAIENVFGELFNANILSREDIRKSIHEFVDVDEDQRMERCVMDFIRVTFSVKLTKQEQTYFLKKYYEEELELGF